MDTFRAAGLLQYRRFGSYSRAFFRDSIKRPAISIAGRSRTRPKNSPNLISTRLGVDLGPIRDLQALARGPSSRIYRLKIIGDRDYLIIGKELEIRRALSRTHLYSSAFVVDKEQRPPSHKRSGMGTRRRPMPNRRSSHGKRGQDLHRNPAALLSWNHRQCLTSSSITIHVGAWSLAFSQPRTSRSTPALTRRGAADGLSSR